MIHLVMNKEIRYQFYGTETIGNKVFKTRRKRVKYVKEGDFTGKTATIAELLRVLKDCPDQYDV